jgi:demethylmenaquinone methyltransferase/2-methoxy-6-polyprenyl-1,4-benzoquinol methylase
MLAADKRQYVQRMFSEIAPRYDLLNHLLSFNVDRSWRRRAIAALAWERAPGGTYVDLCAGTLDVSVALASQPRFSGYVLGADFAEPMLRAGSAKAGQSVRPVVADALQLPFPDQSAEGAIVAFGIRNVADLDAALVETFRILKPGARFVILEFSTPRSAIVRTGYHAYFHHVLPTIGGAISGHRTAYRYLPDSVTHFPSADALAERMRDAGFAKVTWEPLTFGVAALHVGHRP